MATSTDEVFPDVPFPPGGILAEELEARGMTQKELAIRMGRPPQVINEIVKGKKSITPETAIGLGRVFGINPQFFVNLEANYQFALAKQRDRDRLVSNLNWLKEYPVAKMIKLGWISAGRDRLSRLEALLSFLGVDNAEPAPIHSAIGFRATEAARQKVSLGALIAWLRQGEIQAQAAQTAPYSKSEFENALAEIRKLTELAPEEFHPRIEQLCARSGVIFCVVPELPKSGANGASRWISNDKAMIQMSLRHKWADIFWFTFFSRSGAYFVAPTTSPHIR